MTGDTGRHIELFTGAVQLPPEERAEFLDRACAGDEELRCKIEVLLNSHDRAGIFLEEPATWELDETRLRVAAGEKPGDRVGNCRLLQQIGEGGCGVVFLAEQEEPVRRRVALKVIKPGMDTRSVIARFEAERQALALMDHPHIAHVFDAGATASGRPYFVMELVEGLKITDYCQRHSLPLDARLKLFTHICDAIEHAHQKGILHRDIKPSNILVMTGQDGKPVPKVIDFGIAKATGGEPLTDKTLVTSWGMLIGTPAYMSPEQATMASAELDTRTDIYSLGVLLYELLTGATPFDTHELLKAGLDEVRRVIREVEPVRPSTRLSTMAAADLANVAKHHAAEVPKLIREMRGDLDWIVMKALEKDRTRRYATTNALAMDIARYLAGDAVLARPPSTAYRFGKLVRRNRLWFAAGSMVAAVLVIGFVAVALALKREQGARQEADKARQQAEVDKTQSQQATRFLKAMLEGVGPSVARGRDTRMLEEILAKTESRFPVELAGQPAVRADLQTLLGRVYRDLDQLPKSEAMLREALELRVGLFGEESEAVTDTLIELGYTLSYSSKGTEAETIVRRSLVTRRKLLGEEHGKVAESYYVMGSIFWARQDIPEAEAMLQKSLAMLRRLHGDKSALLGDSLMGLGCVRYGQKNYREAEDFFRQALDHWGDTLADEHPSKILCLENLANMVSIQGKRAEAVPLLRQVVETNRKVHGPDHALVAKSLHSLIRVLLPMGKFDEAEVAGREALAVAGKAWGTTREESLMILRDLINALLHQRKFEDAERLFADLLPAGQELTPEYSGLLYERCDTHAMCRRWREAADDAVLLLKQSPESHEHYLTLAPLLVQLGDLAEYQRLCASICGKFGETKDVFVADRMAKACLILPLPALDLKAVAAMAERAVNDGSKEVAAPYFQFCKGLAEFRLGHYEEALTWTRRAADGPFREAKAGAFTVLAMAEFKLGRLEEARAALAECDKLIAEQLPDSEQQIGREWRDWLIIQALRSEAKRLMEGEAD
ncbi:tetratricopeptide repeat protein [Luteolibacter arcticus]|uniref:Tetratricopeptide repeat protein n=1 Tax=Luteolibacter arcticus TaxID=1581411 RepID=A0ABT3GHQ5_9BACT|nr:serine/threonine-protein kinase [Luteolibacter arcticus]MCW1922839.1 tetratricopeptide repeat protein [Luteolibacter arcticus]